MKKFFDLPTMFLLSLVFTASMGIAKDYVIYTITQDFPMGHKDEVLKKNYYIDMGKTQGLNKGTVVDVYRSISMLDPYEQKKRFEHKIKIAELKITHTEDLSSVAVINKTDKDENQIVLDVDALMIGDIVKPHVK
jgi:hypothetical protein